MAKVKKYKLNETFFKTPKNNRRLVKARLRLTSATGSRAEKAEQKFNLRCRHCNALVERTHAFGCPQG